MRLRSGRIEHAPDAVVAAGDASRVAALLAACAESGVAVVPFGGGTSVVGGAEALAGDHSAVVSLDLSGLRAVEVDRTSLVARLGPACGARCRAAARRTRRHARPLPAVLRAGDHRRLRRDALGRAGLERLRRGFDELVTAVELTAPTGVLRTLPTPHTAAGPSLRELVLGSEGTLGVITDVSCRVRPKPEARRARAGSRPTSRRGARSSAPCMSHEMPDVLRLSDEEETRVSLELSGRRACRSARWTPIWRSAAAKAGACSSAAGRASANRSVAAARWPRAGCARAGRPARTGRRSAPGRRPVTRGPTCATSCWAWASSSRRWRPPTPGAASTSSTSPSAARCGTPRPQSIVMCHLSHAYTADGASLYFTFLARATPGGRSSSGAGSARRVRRDRLRGARSPTTTPSASTTPPT